MLSREYKTPWLGGFMMQAIMFQCDLCNRIFHNMETFDNHMCGKCITRICTELILSRHLYTDSLAILTEWFHGKIDNKV